MNKIILLFSFLLFPFFNFAQIVYVNLNATGESNGTTWQNAYTNLSDALESANSDSQIWVAVGTYHPDASDRDNTFLIKNGIAVYGGFQGTETSLNQRNTTTFKTILSGERGSPTDSTDNHFNVVSMYDVDSTTLLDGFTIQDGYAINDSIVPFNDHSLKGGGMYLAATIENTSSNPIIRNCIFNNNQAEQGGAIFLHGSQNTWTHPTIERCEFYGNKAQHGGGAIFQHYGNLTANTFFIKDCIFEANTTRILGGGAIDVHWSTGKISIENCSFKKSSATEGGAIAYEGDDGPGQMIIKGCQFEENEARQGVIRYFARGVSLRAEATHSLIIENSQFFKNETEEGTVSAWSNKSNFSLSISDSHFEDNQSDIGSGVYFNHDAVNDYQNELLINRCQFLNNKSYYGILGARGRPRVDSSTMKIKVNNSLFVNNQGIANFNINNVEENSVDFINCTFSKNKRSYFSENTGETFPIPLFNNQDIFREDSTAEDKPYYFTNCIFDEPNTSLTDIFLSSVYQQTNTNLGFQLENCWLPFDSIENNAIDTFFANCLYNAYPLFADTIQNDYSLSVCSPAVNAGISNELNATLFTNDLVGNERTQHGAIDIGARENVSVSLRPIIAVKPPTTQLNLDGRLEITSVVGGTPPYQFEWSNGIKTEVNANLLIGLYEVTITDANDCSSVTSKSLALDSDTLSIAIFPLDTCLANTNNCQSLQTFSADITDTNCRNIETTWSIASTGKILAEGTGDSFDFEVDLETSYEVSFVVTDSCGNGATATDYFTFTDCQAPNLAVINGLVVSLDINNNLALNPNELILNASDNCTMGEDLVFKISLDNISDSGISAIQEMPTILNLDCNNIGIQSAYIYAVDKAGNYTIAETFIVLQLGVGVNCGNVPVLHKVEGKVTTLDGTAIEGVTIQFEGTKEFKEQTKEDGIYTHLAPRGAYNLTPYKNDDPANGVTTFDIILIRQHILNNKTFDSGSQFLAADVNSSGSITTFDMVILSKLILGINNPFGDNDSWIFIASDFNLVDGMPDLSALPVSRNITTSLETDSGFDFFGIKRGDVNGSVETNTLQQTESRHYSPLYLNVQDQYLQKGNTYSALFNFPKRQPLAGFQLSIQTDDLHLKEINGQIIERGTFSSDKIHSWLAKNKYEINLNWLQTEESDKGQFSLTFTANTSGYLSDLVQLNQRDFINEGYTADLETMDLMLDFQSPKTTVQDLAISVSPNPIRLNHTLLTIENAPAANLWIKIYNNQGQLVDSHQEQFVGGMYQQRLELPSIAGTYWAHVYTEHGQIQQVKLMKL